MFILNSELGQLRSQSFKISNAPFRRVFTPDQRNETMSIVQRVKVFCTFNESAFHDVLYPIYTLVGVFVD